MRFEKFVKSSKRKLAIKVFTAVKTCIANFLEEIMNVLNNLSDFGNEH